MVNYAQMQAIVHRQIKNFGGGESNGFLRRSGTDRAVTLVQLRDVKQERRGSLAQFGDKTILISAVGLDTPPDNELDSLILQDGLEYKIVQPPSPLAPDGVNVLYWEVIARK